MSSRHDPETRKKKPGLLKRVKKHFRSRQPSGASQSKLQTAPTASGDGSLKATGEHDPNAPEYYTNVPELIVNAPHPNVPKHKANVPEHDANAPEYDANAPEHDANAPENEAGGCDETKGPSDEVRMKSLWENAFDLLRGRKPALVKAFQDLLVSDDASEASLASANHSLGPEFIETSIRFRFDARKAKQLVIQLGTKSVNIREQGEKVIKFIMWSDTFISAAVSTQPYAALAWSGVSILLPLLLNASEQNGRMVEGLDAICNLLALYKIKESIYLQGSEKTAYPDCVKAVTELYSNILEYQAHLISHLSKNAAKRGYASTFKLDDWKEMLEKIKSSDAKCKEHFDLFREEKTADFHRQTLVLHNQLLCAQQQLVTMYEAFENQRLSEREDDKEAKVLAALTSDYRGDKDTISKRIRGTCEWFFDDDTFLDWRSKRSGILSVFAGPGCGKSVLARALIDENRIRTNVMTTTVCYFFFKDGDSQRMYGANALSALIHQLFTHQPDLIKIAFPIFKSHGKALCDRLSDLWGILLGAAQHPEAGKIVCVIDALDECEKDTRNVLTQKLTDFFGRKQPDGSSNLAFLITSRPYEMVEQEFHSLLNISTYVRLDGDDDQRSQQISQDINLVIDAKVQHLAEGFDDNGRKRIADQLKGMNNRTYLWLFLTFDIIEGARSVYSKRSEIDFLLSNLPEEVSEAYEKILERSPRKGLAKILLQIILAATRPLSLDEINVAMTLATQNTNQKMKYKSYEDLEGELWSKDDFESSVKNMCGLFVTVHDERVSLIHQTARKFLLNKLDPRLETSNTWKGCLDIATAHGLLSTVCFSYLDLKGLGILRAHFRPPEDDALCCLQDYVALNWATHYKSQHVQIIKNSRKAAKTLCDTSSFQYQNWFPVFCQSRYFRTYFNPGDLNSSLQVASSLGLAYIVDEFCHEVSEIDSQSRVFSGALVLAISGGHDQTAQVLINRGANVNAEGLSGSALQQASAGGYNQIVRLLLDKGADVNQGGLNGNPLIVASEKGHNQIVRLLLDKGADVNAQGGRYNNALTAASASGHDQIVRLLLDKGADVNAQGGNYGNALTAASASGHDQIVQLLLDKGVDFNAKGGPDGTALVSASRVGHNQTVQLLLDKGADVNQGGLNGNPLIVALGKGHDQIVRLLLDKGADVNAEGGLYGAALVFASSMGHNQTVQLLLDKGADVNQGGFLGNSLIVASGAGHDQTVRLLLDKGADINAPPSVRYSALDAALYQGHTQVAQMLRSRGAVACFDHDSSGSSTNVNYDSDE